MSNQTTPPHPLHLALIERYVAAFSKRDAEAMAACYHTEIWFSDPVFASLKGRDAGDMWRMLLSRAKDLSIEPLTATADADGSGGTCSLIAHYTFSQTGRKVSNTIHSTFAFKDGLIVRQADQFDLWKWAHMALGAKGLLLGWSALLKNKVRRTAAAGLAQWQAAKKA